MKVTVWKDYKGGGAVSTVLDQIESLFQAYVLPVIGPDAIITAMPKPTPKAIEPGEIVDVALAVLKGDRGPMLATIDDGQPRVRPISPLRTVGFTVYFASLRDYHKTGELEANSNVEMCYLANGHDQVRISGICEPVTDDVTRQDLWDTSPLLRQFMVTIDNPQLLLYCITPTQVRFMREWALDYHEVPFEQAAP